MDIRTIVTGGFNLWSPQIITTTAISGESVTVTIPLCPPVVETMYIESLTMTVQVIREVPMIATKL